MDDLVGIYVMIQIKRGCLQRLLKNEPENKGYQNRFDELTGVLNTIAYIRPSVREWDNWKGGWDDWAKED